jgi:hypothetical protein
MPDKVASPATYLPTSIALIAPEACFGVEVAVAAAVVLAALDEDEAAVVDEALTDAFELAEEVATTMVVLLAALVEVETAATELLLTLALEEVLYR